MTAFSRDNSAQTGGVSSHIYSATDGNGNRYFYGDVYNEDASYILFDHINTISYWMGSGNDTLTIDGSAASQAGNGLAVDGGGGTDTLNANFSLMTSNFTLTDSSLSTGNVTATHFEVYTLTLGSGNDTVTLNGADGDVIALGAGNDTVSVTNATGYQSFNGGAGFNRLTINNGSQASNVTSYIYTSGSGAGAYFYGSLYNTTSRTDYDFMHKLTYNMGSGNDTLYLDGNGLAAAANTVTVEAGAGSDRLSSDLRVLTTDVTLTDHSLTTSRLSLTGFDVYAISLGEGNDTVTFTHATDATVALYGGNDSVSVTDAVGYSNFNGGGGFNSLSVDNGGQTLGLSSYIYSSSGYFYGNLYNDTSRTDYDMMHKLTYVMGSGNNTLHLDGTSLGVAANSVSVTSGAGHDMLYADLRVITTNIVVTDTTLTTARVTLNGFDQYSLEFGSGNDSVTLTGAGGDTLHMWGGDDTVIISNATDYQAVDGGEGFDVLSVDNSAHLNNNATYIYSSAGYFYGNLYNDVSRTDFDHIESVTYKMGSGNNTLYIDGTSLGVGSNAVNVDAGAGYDSLSANLSTLGRSFSLTDTALTGTRLNLAHFEAFNLTFGSGNDSVNITGASGASLAMAAGNDTVKITSAVDYQSVNGGAGTDSLTVNNAALALGVTSYIYSSGGYFYGNLYNGTSRTDFDNFESLAYTMGNGGDTLTVDATSIASGGKLTLSGGGGADTLNLNLSGAGPQTLTYLSGGVLQVGTSTFSAFETLNLNLGNVSYSVTLTAGNDSFTGGSGDDTIEGGAGNDTLDGANGRDTATYANAGSAVTVSLALQGAAQNTVGAGSDTLSNFENLTGSAYNDKLTGDGNGNVLDGGLGNDTLAGGLGDDSYYITAGDVVTEALNAGTDTVYAAFTYTLGANLEGLVLGGTGDFTGNGNALNNSLTGNSGANLLYGLDGNDVLDGGAGADTLYGGLGDDTYYVDNAGDVVRDYSGQGTDTIFASVTYSLVGLGVENLILTGSAALNATGNTYDNIVTGNAGNNLIDGGTGADTMAGGAGNDTYVVDNAGDVVSEAAGQGTDTVMANRTWTLGTDIENLTLSGTGAFTGTGNTLNNILTGNGGANQLFGLEGDDYIDGGLGADTMTGGAGNDTYVVDNSGDVIVELSGGGGTELVLSSVSYTLAANVEKMTLTGTAAINGIGNSSQNALYGNSGANLLDGKAGNDVLNGYGGNDTLVGGTGADTFVFLAGSGVDRINDFSAADNDLININAYSHGVVNGGGVVISQVGADVMIDLGGGNTITVAGATASAPAFLSHIVW